MIFEEGSALKKIGESAFWNCSLLRNINLPEGLEYIGEHCFLESGLESIALPLSLKIIEKDAFYKCRNLKSVCLPEGLEKIGAGCFS